MSDKPSIARQAWNLMRGRDRRENADGTITNRFGEYIVPYRIKVSGNGVVSANPGPFMFQPRVSKLADLMTAAGARDSGDVGLDDKTGAFYIRYSTSDAPSRGPDLGLVDLPLENSLFDAACQRLGFRGIARTIKGQPPLPAPVPRAPPALHNKFNL